MLSINYAFASHTWFNNGQGSGRKGTMGQNESWNFHCNMSDSMRNSFQPKAPVTSWTRSKNEPWRWGGRTNFLILYQCDLQKLNFKQAICNWFHGIRKVLMADFLYSTQAHYWWPAGYRGTPKIILITLKFYLTCQQFYVSILPLLRKILLLFITSQ